MMERKQLAIYLRLSLEDRQTMKGTEPSRESNSISSQRKLIQRFVSQDPELSQYKIVEFCDDGFSGTSMDRPGIQKLLSEVKKNRIGCVIVKDMSRFSRDYIELGTYLNQIFPFMGIRFLSINDHYDSREHEGTTIEVDTAFQTLLYDLYSKDISIKLKAAIKNKCESGEYVFGQIPFGYKKSTEVKNTVIIHEKEAEIVRYIFSLAVDGRTSTQIARQLYQEGIPTIMQMRHPERISEKKKPTWSVNSVRTILNNRFYLGEMSYGKSHPERAGSKKIIAVPRQEWKIIPNHHDPLVTPEVFAMVSSFRPEQSTKRKGNKHPLVGRLFCGGCGYSLNHKKASGHQKYEYFWCGKHSLLQIPDCCTYFQAPILEEAILFMLNQEIARRGDMAQQKKNLERFQESCLKALENQLEESKRQLQNLMEEKNGLYERYRAGQITAKQYRQTADKLDEMISSLEITIQEKDSEYNLMEEEHTHEMKNMKDIIRFSHMEGLTQEVVDTFIKKITVYKDKRIEIEWNFR
ncbi:MAG: recombinase family protein [Lachnospiraceae bacterium]|nr:recombinase family protein [Lachnospiraceae bacterium]